VLAYEGQEALVLADVKHHRLRSVTEEDDESPRGALAESLHHRAKATGSVARSNDLIEVEGGHWETSWSGCDGTVRGEADDWPVTVSRLTSEVASDALSIVLHVGADVYISADVETDGPIPGRYSMLAFGLAVTATFDGTTFAPRDPTAATFYRELQPMGDKWLPEAVDASGLNRAALARDGAEPSAAMEDAVAWVSSVACSARPVLVGYPVVFDWMFMHWYFMAFAGNSPFGFSGALDIKTIYQQKARVTLDEAGRTDLPASLRSSRPHTHNALDDAIEQAEIFNKLFVWDGR